MKTSDERICDYLELLDEYDLGAPYNEEEAIRMDTAYAALTGEEMERVERILTRREPAPTRGKEPPRPA